MSGAPGNCSRSVHRAVVDLVQLALDAQGIAATPKRATTTISDSLDDDVVLAPDLSLAGIDLKVTSRLHPHRLSENLESVQRAAAIRGVDVAAFVQWRSDLPVDDSYVITSLRDFSKLVRGDHLPSP